MTTWTTPTGTITAPRKIVVQVSDRVRTITQPGLDVNGMHVEPVSYVYLDRGVAVLVKGGDSEPVQALSPQYALDGHLVSHADLTARGPQGSHQEAVAFWASEVEPVEMAVAA